MPLQPLLAAGLDWLEGIVPIVLLLLWIAGQVRTIFGGARGKAAGPVVVRPAPRRPRADDDPHRELARQIEEFLRDPVARGREAPPAPPRPAESPAEQRRRKETTPRQQQPPLPRKPARPPAAAPRVESAAPQPLGSLGGHVTDVARHVQDAFAHEIEHLPAGLPRAATAAPAAAASTPARDIAAALRDPATLRQLVIVREVLERPVERW